MADISYAKTDELVLIQSTARQFLEDRVNLVTVRELMMSDDGFDQGLWKEMAEMGWMGLAISEEHGGSGYGLVELSALAEEMGRMVTPGPFFASVVLATTAIQQTGTDDQKAELLPPLASGESIATVALYESPRGWDLDELSTRATFDEAGWVISGSKRYVLDGHLADILIVVASVEDGIGLFVVPADADGVEVQQTPTLDATRRQSEVVFKDVSVPTSARLGEGDARAALGRTMAIATAALAAEQVGGASWCLETSVEYAKTRYQFGRPIGSYQAIKHRCAEMLIKTEHAKSTAYHAARVADDLEEMAIAAPLAGSICSDAFLWAAGETIQIHGGIGFTWEHDAHLYFKRAKSSSLLFGDPHHHRDLLGKAIGV